MTMLPSIFGNDLFDTFTSFPFDDDFFTRHSPLYGKHEKAMMKTDVRETENSYELDIDLPGFKKDQLSLTLKDGYLTIQASKGLDKDEKDEKDHYIRRERYAGSMSRSYFVGKDLTEEDIHAKYEDGILRLSIPKKEAKKVEEKKTITIEG